MTVQTTDFSGIILSGGLNSRMGGNNKGMLPLGDKTFLTRLIDTIKPLVSELIIVTRQPHLYAHLPCTIVEDLFSIRSSLTGIHAGLYHASNPYSFIVACDTPLLKRDLVQKLLFETVSGEDIIVPQDVAGFEPLCAVYSKRCLSAIESLLRQNLVKVSKLFNLVTIKPIPKTALQHLDPNLESFFNVNTPEDMLKLSN
jgi:molybdopterin-guanine dinucleotide biosynthesis protein A